jgi:hypothetical protein
MKTVSLSQAYTTHTGEEKSLTLREPKFNDVMALGEPVATGWMAGGVVVRNINYECVLGYAERLVQKPWDPALLGGLNVRDTQAVVEAIIGFFRPPETSPDEPTSSSSSSAGTPAPSAP